MRCLENHDQPRICSFVKDPLALENFTAFLYFLKGTTLIYAGQEFCCTEIPSLFEKDVFPRDLGDISGWLTKLNGVKKNVLSSADAFVGQADDKNDIAVLERSDMKIRKLGVFSLKGKSAAVKVSFPDGEYTNHLDGSKVIIQEGNLLCEGKPMVLICNA